MLRKVSFALVGVLMAGVAQAAPHPAEQAAESLARAQSVDLKCNYLSAGERDRMSALVAQAELSLAAKESTEETKAAMARGRDAGVSAACSNTEQDGVRKILRQALDAATPDMLAKPKAVDAGKPSNAVVLAAPQKPVKAKKGELTPAVPPAVAADAMPMDSALGTYASLTEEYFIAVKCGSGNPSALYQNIVTMHGQLMGNHNATAVAGALKKGETAAGARGCS